MNFIERDLTHISHNGSTGRLETKLLLIQTIEDEATYSTSSTSFTLTLEDHAPIQFYRVIGGLSVGFWHLREYIM